MRIGTYRISHYAAKRMAQRNLNIGEVAIALRFGRKEHREGVEFFFLGKHDVPQVVEKALNRLIGLTVIAADECILTVYRNASGLARIKHKVKRCWVENASGGL